MILKLLRCIVFFIYAMVALVFTRQGMNIYVNIKYLVFCVGALLVLFLLVYQRLKAREWYAVSRNVLWALLAYVLICGCSLFNAINYDVGIEQFIILLCEILLAIAISQVAHEEKHIKIFLKIYIITALFNSVYGICQYWGYDFVPRIHNYMAVGVFGNKSHLGSFLVPVLPIILFLLWNVKNFKLRTMYIIFFIVIAWCVVLTNARAAWVGAIFSIGTSFAWIAYHRKNFYRLKSYWLYFMGLIFLLLMVVSMGYFYEKNKVLPGHENHWKNAKSILDIQNDKSILFRLGLWRASFNMLYDQPLLGVGYGNYSIVYPIYRDVLEKQYLKDDATPENAHNDFITIAAETGFLGILSFVFLIIISILEFCRKRKDDLDFDVISYIAISFLTILVISIFDFPIFRPASQFYFWAFIGIMMARSKSQRKLLPLNQIMVTMWLVIIGMVGIVGVQRLWTQFKADLYLGNAKKSFEQCQWPETIKQAKYSLELNPWEFKAHMFLGRAYFKTQQYSKAILELIVARRYAPFFPIIYNELGLAYDGAGRTEQALKCFQKGHQIDPLYESIIFNLASQCLKMNDSKKAMEIVSDWQPSDSQMFNYHFILGRIYSELNQLDKAHENYQRALKAKPNDITTIVNIANIQARKKEYEGAIYLYDFILRIDPNNVLALQGLAAVYFEQEKWDQAFENAYHLIQVDPQHLIGNFLLARIYLRKDELGKAYQHLELVHKLDPNFEPGLELYQSVKKAVQSRHIILESSN